jgi:hypothetical protein
MAERKHKDTRVSLYSLIPEEAAKGLVRVPPLRLSGVRIVSPFPIG